MSWPSHKLRDFVSMGRGIRGRYSRCQEWWQPHLECTKDFLTRHVKPCEQLLVLGAGSLLDLDIALLLERCRTVHLYDADPTCESVWRAAAGKEYGRRVLGHHADCTETLERWSSGLGQAIRAGELSAFLNACRAPVPAWQDIPHQGIISLNLLGQIPLYWRDRVVKMKSDLSQAEVASLMASMEQLQIAHLEGLLSKGDAWSIVLTDTEYYFYHADRSEWRIEPALFGEASQCLYGAYPGRKIPESWLWHVSPQFVECDDEGEIHRVEGFFRNA